MGKCKQYYEDYSIEILRGGKVQWCWTLEVVKWNRRIKACDTLVITWLEPVLEQVWGLRLIYYAVKLFEQVRAQIQQLRILFYSSGFVSFTRGLHFKWCKRWKNYCN